MTRLAASAYALLCLPVKRRPVKDNTQVIEDVTAYYPV